MKRIQFIAVGLLLITILLSGCSGIKSKDKLDDNSKPDLNIQEYTDTIRIINPSAVKRNAEQEQEHINMWESYMGNKYRLNLDLIYTNRTKENLDDSDESNKIIVSDIEAIAEKGGLIYIKYFSDLNLLIESGLIQPINEYINDNEILRAIDKELFGAFTDTEGNIWAVPLYEETTISPRIYDVKWLNSSGMGVPKTVDEFYEYAKYIADGDPDRDGKKNTYITWYNYFDFSSDFKDIFRAFGCYADSPPGLIAYNPLKGKYEIAAFNENFEDLMMYIKKLKDENLIINATQSTRDDYISKDFKIGSTYSKNFFNTDEEAYGFSLSGINNKFFLEKPMVPAFVVINGTLDIEEKLNSLYNTLFESSEIRYDLLYGIKETDYFDKGDHYEVYRPSEHLEMYTTIAINTKFNEAKYLDKPVTWEGTEVSEDYIKQVNKVLTINNAAKSINDSNIYYSIPYNMIKDHQYMFALNLDIVVYENHLYEDILVNDIPVTQAVETFKLKMEELGIIEILNKLNGE